MTSTTTVTMTCPYDMTEYTIKYEFPEQMDKGKMGLIIKTDELNLRNKCTVVNFSVNFVTGNWAYVDVVAKTNKIRDNDIDEFAKICEVCFILSFENLNKSILKRVKRYEEEAADFAKLYYETDSIETELVSYQLSKESKLSETLSYRELCEGLKPPRYTANLTMIVDARKGKED